MVVKERLGVVGAGTMGNGIAHVMARGGQQPIRIEVADLERGLKEAIRTAGGERHGGRVPTEVGS